MNDDCAFNEESVTRTHAVARPRYSMSRLDPARDWELAVLCRSITGSRLNATPITRFVLVGHGMCDMTGWKHDDGPLQVCLRARIRALKRRCRLKRLYFVDPRAS